MNAPVSSFVIAVLPDTQDYSRFATVEEGERYQRRYGSTPFAAQTGWLAAHAARHRIPFVIHLGDVVDQHDHPQEWAVADLAMQRLETAGVPYSILAGNHDIVSMHDYRQPADQAHGTDAHRDLTTEPYLRWFPPQRAAAQSTFGGRDASGFHEYHVVETHGVRLLVLSLSWRISDAGIAWARDVLAQHPDVPVILASHQLLNIAEDDISPLETPYGRMLWDRLIRDHDQIFMTLSGHYHGAAYLPKINDHGHTVHQMVVNYQMDHESGNALMRLYEFDLTNEVVHAMSFSPWVPQKPPHTRTSDDVVERTEPNHRFSIPLHFASRFAGFTKWQPTLDQTAAPVLPAVRQQLAQAQDLLPLPV